MTTTTFAPLLLPLLPRLPAALAFTAGPRRAAPRAPPAAPVAAAAPDGVAAEESGGMGGELWKIQRVDRVSDWATSGVGTYPNPLSRKAKVPESWFVGPNDAVAAKVRGRGGALRCLSAPGCLGGRAHAVPEETVPRPDIPMVAVDRQVTMSAFFSPCPKQKSYALRHHATLSSICILFIVCT